MHSTNPFKDYFDNSGDKLDDYAKRAHLSPRTIGSYIRAERQPHPNRYEQLSNASKDRQITVAKLKEAYGEISTIKRRFLDSPSVGNLGGIA